MYRAPGTSGSLDLLLPSQPHFAHDPSQYSSSIWPRSNLDTLTPSSYGTGLDKSRTSGPSKYTRPTPLQGLSSYSEAPVREGLRTPPSDEMSTTYQPQQYNSYAHREVDYQQPYNMAAAAVHPYAASHGHPARSSAEPQLTARPASPIREATTTGKAEDEDSTRRKSEILPSLRIPSSVDENQGSLGEFAAKITCLFWFESTATLHQAEQFEKGDSPPEKRLALDATPTTAFKKWVVTILTITQVTPNVVLLALLFIYRLKTLNPTVKGRAGSEYRLLTVALMLGNKFLDDNTYTNKTWAEVSGISVQEIHVMEVEFLSNMRYSLLASREQWKEWHAKLKKFDRFFEAATSLPATIPSPIAAIQPPILPSPTSLQSSPPSQNGYSQATLPYNYGQQWPGHGHFTSGSHLPSMPDLVPGLEPNNRKRSYDLALDEPPAKRLHPDPLPMPASAESSRGNVPRLPVPNLSVSTTQAMSNGHGHPAHGQNVPLLPPLGGRAMSSVYPATPASYTPSNHGAVTPTVQLTHMHPGSQYGTPSRRHSPRSVAELMSMNSSPISGVFPHHAQNSPSFFLQQRSSPYKPVRLPHTLLHPPPSGHLQGYVGSHEQMHYNPLGRRNDFRTGIIPEGTQPNYQHWTVLPQPNFYN